MQFSSETKLRGPVESSGGDVGDAFRGFSKGLSYFRLCILKIHLELAKHKEGALPISKETFPIQETASHNGISLHKKWLPDKPTKLQQQIEE